MSGGHRLAAPAHHQQQRPAAQPVAEVGDRVQRGLVRGVNVVEQDDPRPRSFARRADDRGDALEHTHLGAGAVQRQCVGHSGSQARELGQKERGIRQALGRQSRGPTAWLDVAHGLAQQLDDRSVREAGLVLMAARGEHHRPLIPCPPRELLRQARLSDPGLPLDHGQAAIRLCPGVGVDERRQLVLPSHERQLGRRLAELRGGRRAQVAASVAAGGASVPSLTWS